MNTETTPKAISPFLPLLLVGLSCFVLMGWNLIIVVRQHSDAVKITAQQDMQLAQSAQAEIKLKQMMSDLVTLAKTDTDAETIIKRYGISFSAPAGNAPMTMGNAPAPKVKKP